MYRVLLNRHSLFIGLTSKSLILFSNFCASEVQVPHGRQIQSAGTARQAYVLGPTLRRGHWAGSGTKQSTDAWRGRNNEEKNREKGMAGGRGGRGHNTTQAGGGEGGADETNGSDGLQLCQFDEGRVSTSCPVTPDV
jgi:hypothetical protein